MQFRPNKICFLLFAIIATVFSVSAQDGPKSTTLSELKNAIPADAPTTSEVMRERISKAKAYLVVKNYPAAVYELENIRRETNDATINRVLNVLLMHAYLEQGDYKKAQKFLKELQKNPAKAHDYFAVAGQVISGARTQLARYQALGVGVSDTTLPDEAKEDLDNMRETLELIAAQSKLMGKKKELTGTAVAVLEESSAARGNLARDAYDEKRWADQVSEAREHMVTPRSNIIDAVEGPVVVANQTPDVTLVAKRVEEEAKLESLAVKEKSAADRAKVESLAIKEKSDEDAQLVATMKPVSEEIPSEILKKVPEQVAKLTVDKPEEVLKASPTTASIQPTDRKVRVISSAEKTPVEKIRPVEEAPPDTKSDEKVEKKPAENTAAANVDRDAPLPIGSLIGYATQRRNPVYPRQARAMRMQGTVKVEVLIDKDGKVAKVENISGPALLQRAARDAMIKWRFKPFLVDGQAVEAAGFVSFRFNL